MENQETPHAGHKTEGCFICGVARPFLRNIWTDATRNHFRNSRIEFLKGVRSLIDDRIEKMSKPEQKGHRVVVE